MRTHTQGHDWPERDTNLWRPAGLCRHCPGDIHRRLGAGADPQGLCSVLGAQGIVDYIGSIQQLKPGLGHGCLDARPARHRRQGAEIGGHTSVRGQGRFGSGSGLGVSAIPCWSVCSASLLSVHACRLQDKQLTAQEDSGCAFISCPC